jgi:hypothetical protein
MARDDVPFAQISGGVMLWSWLGNGKCKKSFRKKKPLHLESLESRLPMTVQFLFDYSLDTQGFFNDSARRSALSQAGHMLADRFDDALAAISPSGTNRWTPFVAHPGSGNKVNISRTNIPANTIVIYAGARNLPGTLAIGGTGGFSATGTQSWFNTIKGRGQSGALLATPTDVAPWGGSLTFDSAGVDWNFSTTSIGLTSGKTDFISVAMHELAHVMGAGLSGSWKRLVSGSNFVGAKASAANGGPVPLTGDRAHFKEGLKSHKIEVALDPSLTTGTRKFFSNVDYAALLDIGWKSDGRDDTIPRAPHVLSRRTGDTTAVDTKIINNGISFDRDVDIVRIYADAGMRLDVSAFTPTGRKQVDTYLRVFSATGQQLAFGNQGGLGGTDTATLNITRSDYYFIGISSAASRSYNPHKQNSAPVGPTGDYRMTITLQDQLRTASLTASGEPASRADLFFAAFYDSYTTESENKQASKKKPS